MSNQEVYEIMCHKAEKYDKMVDVLDKIRAEIEEPLKINKGIHTDSAKAQAIALSWCIEIIDKYRGTDEITEHYKKLGEYYNKGENE